MRKNIVLVFHKENDGLWFEKVVIALKAKYRIISLEELEQVLVEKKNQENICHISFDDGDESFYRVIFPILRKQGIPASLFVSPDIISSGTNYWFQDMEGFDETIMKNILANQLNVSTTTLDKYAVSAILKCLPFIKIKNAIEVYQLHNNCENKSPQNMSAVQLREVDASGLVAVGAHTINHPILKNEDDQSCEFEITESIKRLAALLKHPVKYFAYPNGRPGVDFTNREINCLKKNKIAIAFSTELDHFTVQSNLLSVPRMSFASMGLSPSNPLVAWRLQLGKKWIDIKSIGKPSENKVREKIRAVLNL